jgi:hypothetical protein
VKKERHYRLVNLTRNEVVIQFYVFPGRRIDETVCQAADRMGINLEGLHRIERLVSLDGRLTWLRGADYRFTRA